MSAWLLITTNLDKSSVWSINSDKPKNSEHIYSEYWTKFLFFVPSSILLVQRDIKEHIE